MATEPRPDAAEAVLGALGDATRRQVLTAVAHEGPCTATELAAELPVTRQAVAKHLAVLRDAGLVQVERAGRDARYAVVPGATAPAAAWLTEVGAAWDRRLGRLRRHLVEDA